MRKRILKKVKRVVIKVGSSVLREGGRGVFAALAKNVHNVKKTGREVIIVSSGAIALGMKKLSLSERPKTIPERQAVAAVGQVVLMNRYALSFNSAGEKVAQALLTHDDFAERKRFLNARNTLITLLSLGVCPVINENDTVSTEEIKFGDNDKLAALTTNLIEADMLIMLSDIEGVYDKDPKTDVSAKRIPLIEDIDALKIGWGSVSAYGTGGITSKLAAAKTAAHFGCATVIANGKVAGVLKKIFDGEDVGTLILPEEDRLTSKKHWIAYSTRPTGRIIVDDGAKTALIEKKRSLLPSGIMKVEGGFEAGDVVHCVDEKGMEFARGVTNYSSVELEKIRGIRTKEIEKRLGYKVYDEVIHRDNLVVM